MSQLYHSNSLESEAASPKDLADPKQTEFWRKRLEGAARSSLLNNRTTPNQIHWTKFKSIIQALPGAKIVAFSRQNKISEQTLIAGAWSFVLSCYNPEQQALIGIRFPNTPTKQQQLWPFSVAVPGNQNVIQWLAEQERTLFELQQAKPITLTELHFWLNAPAQECLIESIVDFRPGETHSCYPLFLRPTSDWQSAEFVYSQELCSPELIQRVSKQFSCALDQMLSNPNTVFTKLDILPPEERTQILIDWNDTKKDFPPIESLQQFVEQQVAKTPDGIAVEVPASEPGKAARLTYRDLNARANQIAHHLQKNGIGPDSIVGICLERSIELAIGVLGIIKAGAAYVPFDPSYPKERLEFMISDTNAPIILTQKALRERLPGSAATILCLDSDWQTFQKENVLNPRSRVNHDHLAYLIYTSGSTGKPKGVAMRQGPLINLLHWQLQAFSTTPAARTLQFASINFDVSFQEIFSTWCGGGTLVIISEDQRRDSGALLQFLQRNRLERIFLPFVALKHLAEAAQREDLYPERLREVITAGEQLQITPQLVEFFKKLPKCTLENQYGPSEAHVVTAHRLQGSPENWPPLPSIGKPISNTQIYVLNTHLKPVPIGAPGELFIGGVCLARGYLNRPELTAEKFIASPFTTVERSRLYRTGDLARFLPDGNVEFLGRIDHQVKIRGFRIELGEIEALLSKHPEIREAVAMARDTASGDKQLVAYVVPNSDTLNVNDLRTYLKELMPSYAIPSCFVVLRKLPLSPNGKVDRRALPDPITMEPTGNVAEVKMPRDPLEMQIKLGFERFLNRRPIGIDVSFFEIGGDSLQAMNLVLELERITGKKIPLSILYQASTPEALATVIRETSQESSFSSLVPLQPLGSKRPLYLVHTTPGDVLGYGNLVYHLTDRPCFGIQSLGMNREDLAHTSVQEMAAYYVKLIRENQPQGPYFLGGWCYGGIIAVEMAHQLLASGEKVGPLILIETPAPAPSLWNSFYFLRRIGCALNMTPRQWIKYLSAKVHYYRGIRTENEKRYKRVEVQEKRSSEEIENHNRFLAKLEHLYHANLSALNTYHSRFYPGQIVLFNAAEQDPAVIQDPKYGWPGLAQAIQAHVIPGDHDTILMEPHVRVLAQKLTECLGDE